VLLQWLAPLLGGSSRLSVAVADVPVEPKDSCVTVRALEFETVYEDHFEFVWRNLSRLGVLPKDVDDATHDVFLVVHQKLDEFDGEGSVRAWLFAILRRVAWHYRRSLARKRTDPLNDEDPVDHRSLTNDDYQSKREAVSLVHRILEQIPEERRSVFVLAELEQLTVPNIAEMLKIPLNTAYSRLRLARRDFEQKLRQIDASARRNYL
jgi:RNA polymerase sigma-70 factor (ECF subfamily)